VVFLKNFEIMTTITQIANLYRLNYDVVYRAAQRMYITPIKKGLRIRLYNEWQVMLIIENLWHCGKVDGFIYESSMNKPEKQEPFEDFKKRVYGRKN